jgi:hypothetical protein
MLLAADRNADLSPARRARHVRVLAASARRRLGLPKELQRSLACTNIVENMMATVRRVCRNVKRLSPLRPPPIPKGDLATRFALLWTALAAFVPLLLLVQWAKLEWLV